MKKPTDEQRIQKAADFLDQADHETRHMVSEVLKLFADKNTRGVLLGMLLRDNARRMEEATAKE